MKKLKEFLSLKDIEKTQIYKELQCSKNEALILKELCKNYMSSNSYVNAYVLLSDIFGKENFAYLDALKDLKSLILKGFVTQNSTFFKEGMVKNSKLILLQSELNLSLNFLEFLEDNAVFKNEKIEAYVDYFEYLRAEFYRIGLYERLSFIKFEPCRKKFKEQIQNYEKYIKQRLRKSKIHNILSDIFKEYKLDPKEQIVFIALLKQEYSLNENSTLLLENLLALISENEMQFTQNKALFKQGSKFIDYGLVESEAYFNSFGIVSQSFFLSDEILQRIINYEPKQSKKIKLENALKEQKIFELIESNTDIKDVIMPRQTKELLASILKQQDKKVLARLSEWGIKRNKNIEAKIIFYGPPGTGKTMSALSMAKAMKKEILSFDCSKILSKWVGESEANVRKIFDSYKNIVQACKESPILLLNEADQFLSTRVQANSGSEKMHNQMQNIFLEQIERFSGVLIATTNFLESLDSAFSRRFDYKIEFKKPDFEDRLKIWQRFLPKNAEFDKEFQLKILAHYELSGAQILMIIKNTALKAAVSKEGIFTMKDFLDNIRKEIDSSFDKNKIVGF